MLSFALAIFYIGLATIPCADEVIDNLATLEIVLENSDDHDHEDEADDCSPFCVCQCCSNHFTNDTAFCELSVFSPAIDRSSIFKDNLTNSYLNTILEPPRV